MKSSVKCYFEPPVVAIAVITLERKGESLERQREKRESLNQRILI